MLITGAVCLSVALVEAWLLIAHFASEAGPIARLIPERRELLRSHIDYLMMSQFLFVFYGLTRLLEIALPGLIVVALCAGSFFNPCAFLIRAICPSIIKQPPASFMAFSMASSLATTIGYLSVAWIIVRVALK